MEKLFPARSGTMSAESNGILLHSRMDPEKEAERFASSINLPGGRACIVLLGSCLSVTSQAIRARFPRAYLVTVSWSAFFSAPEQADASWNPSSALNLRSFFQRVLQPHRMHGLVVVEWQPARTAWPDLAGHAERTLRDHIRLANGTLATTKQFGRTWMSNTLRNLAAAQDWHQPLQRGGCIVVAASGPSLGDHFSTLRTMREHFELWALPSSIPALYSQNLVPDVIVSTDGGFHAFWHLAAISRQGKKPVLLAPLSGLPQPGRKFGIRTLYFSQKTFVEKALSSLLPGLHATDSAGTVAAVAIDLALAEAETVILCGLDLAARDILEHVRPHAFDRVWDEPATRLQPALHRRFAWMDERYRIQLPDRWRQSEALQTYQTWFSREELGPGLFRLPGRDFPANLFVADGSHLSGSRAPSRPMLGATNGLDKSIISNHLNKLVQNFRAILSRFDETNLDVVIEAKDEPARLMVDFFMNSAAFEFQALCRSWSLDLPDIPEKLRALRERTVLTIGKLEQLA